MQIGQFIDGNWRNDDDTRVFEVADPWSGATASLGSGASSGDVADAVLAAQQAFPAWADETPQVRQRLLSEAANALEERREQIREVMTAETGGTRAWGDFNVSLAAAMLRDAGARAASAQQEAVLDSGTPGLRSRAVRGPRGVCVGIAPWNAPVILGVRAMAVPLATGNTVIFKGSERCPATHAAIVEAIASAGFPPGVVNLLTSHPDDAPSIVAQLIADEGTQSVNFTGSTRVGRVIAGLAAQSLTHTVLELGGKAPLLVLDDGSVDEAVDATTFGAFMNAGQICMSTELAIVDRSVAEEFEQKLAARADALRVGDPGDGATEVGPMISPTECSRVVALIDDARAKGARILAGGVLEGKALRPTVVADVTPEMALYATESFGPVVAVIRVDDDEEALRVANSSCYGLSAAVFGQDTDRAERIAARVRSGICHVNSATVHDEPQAPFGGVKDSGWGRFGGDAGVAEFTEIRWLTAQHSTRHYPI